MDDTNGNYRLEIILLRRAAINRILRSDGLGTSTP
jgi:hypothetical protein